MASNFVEIAAQGDAILVVGHETCVQKMKVDTLFLKAASEMFRAMLHSPSKPLHNRPVTAECALS